MTGKLFIAALLSAAAAAAAAQETAYVTDMLQLGIHRAQDTSDAAFASLASGTELQVLERVSNYARVRTPAGQEGWVRSAFLVSEQPARHRVAGLEEELEALREELARSQAARIGAEEQAARLRQELESDSESLGSMQATLSRLRSENEAYESRLETYRRSLPLVWVVAALIVTLVGGFVGGLWWLDALIRRRHGGFRVY